ncbi:PD-(D/E)XK motif protein [Jejuia pallidilutea]|uniref:PD-(D/E)XK motif protein n=1 Tax=Jejuia pallidilutea TaxID=504487 RepID=A0A090VXV7_9FLAO|nr:PD-(D/E)XK motif protein [Jejuia pallidilutea]GAL66334.1 hypothetical protein JCM19301_2429 [Jejuia pallidilutea]GAL69580.1 hypothetical protein JCM19302_3769 [Jejuia pallidilutea]GAL87954.1 hypothetical protein JCM19538_2317 [Jejuia pallidilutea]
MKILKHFKSLEIPKQGRKIFNAISLKDFPFAKVAKNNDGFPVILIESKIDNTFLTQKNIRLKYLELNHNLECKITENGKTDFANYSVITFKSGEEVLQSYYFGIVENLLKELSKKPTQKEVFETFKGFIEVFRALSNSPKTTIQGLWSELLLIETSKNPEILVNYWHNRPEEKFDFNADTEKIEVKSSSNMERIHIFTSEQLNAPKEKKVLIASVFAKQSSNGRSISDLLNSILVSLNEDSLIEKLYSIVSNTLGSSLEQGLKIKFDYDIAKNSLRFYDSELISKIEKINIPNNVSEVKYKSDLTNIKPIDPIIIKSNELLFKSLKTTP